ncbi:polysaccharide biosynthesis tyrosine autokinase [Candidatus Pelagibacter sp.]|jgi:polysaccharide biosynthesis transport protein|nr:polysaccharide biosynthesis tyrosine autokinase [Candidatus Pelagibacter sp.]
MINDNIDKTLEFIDLDPKFLFSILKKYLIHLIAFVTLVTIIVFLFSLNLNKKYQSTAKIVIEPDENNIVNIQEYSNNSQNNRINNQIAIFKSDQVLEYIIQDKKNSKRFESFFAENNKNFIQKIFNKKKTFDIESLKGILSSSIKISNIQNSDILVLSFVSTNPRVAKLALESIINSYQRYEIDSKIQITGYANQKISERLNILVNEMDIAQKKLSKYKETNKLIDTGNVKELKINEIQSISQRIIEAKQKYQNQQNDLLSIKVAEGDIDALLAIKDLNSRRDITNIKDLLSTNESNIQSLSLIYTEKHPKVIQSKDQNKNLKKQLKKILDTNIEQKAFELSNLDSFIKLSEREMERVTSELRIIEEKESGMLKFTRELESSKNLYQSFLQRVKETNEAQNLQLSKLKILETPNLPGSHFYPNPKKNSIIAFIFSAFGAFVLLFFKEMNSSALRNTEAIDSLNILQLGVLPRVDKTKSGADIIQMFSSDNESHFAESIRSSRTIIESKFKNNSSFLITSSNPSEGKTTFAFNLALSFEKSNKVLFIEGDLRRPTVLNRFVGIQGKKNGLGEIISGKSELNEVIHKIPGTKLDIITSGEIKIDMSDVVSKDQLKKFFDTLKIEYDYVIIDSPPVQPVSDTLILAQSVDNNFFIIRADDTTTGSLMSSIKKIKSVGAKIDGIVLNDVDTSKGAYGYYNYYQNYYGKPYERT